MMGNCFICFLSVKGLQNFFSFFKILSFICPQGDIRIRRSFVVLRIVFLMKISDMEILVLNHKSHRAPI